MYCVKYCAPNVEKETLQMVWSLRIDAGESIKASELFEYVKAFRESIHADLRLCLACTDVEGLCAGNKKNIDVEVNVGQKLGLFYSTELDLGSTAYEQLKDVVREFGFVNTTVNGGSDGMV